MTVDFDSLLAASDLVAAPESPTFTDFVSSIVSDKLNEFHCLNGDVEITYYSHPMGYQLATASCDALEVPTGLVLMPGAVFATRRLEVRAQILSGQGITPQVSCQLKPVKVVGEMVATGHFAELEI